MGIPSEEKQVEYITAWVETLFAALRHAAGDDEEELARLRESRECFFRTMASSESAFKERGEVRLIH